MAIAGTGALGALGTAGISAALINQRDALGRGDPRKAHKHAKARSATFGAPYTLHSDQVREAALCRSAFTIR